LVDAVTVTSNLGGLAGGRIDPDRIGAMPVPCVVGTTLRAGAAAEAVPHQLAPAQAGVW